MPAKTDPRLRAKGARIYLENGRNGRAAARQTGVSQQTFYRWLAQPDFLPLAPSDPTGEIELPATPDEMDSFSLKALAPKAKEVLDDALSGVKVTNAQVTVALAILKESKLLRDAARGSVESLADRIAKLDIRDESSD